MRIEIMHQDMSNPGIPGRSRNYGIVKLAVQEDQVSLLYPVYARHP